MIGLSGATKAEIFQVSIRAIFGNGFMGQLVYKPLCRGGPLLRRSNIDLALKKLDWKSCVQPKEGLEPPVAYFEGAI